MSLLLARCPGASDHIRAARMRRLRYQSLIAPITMLARTSTTIAACIQIHVGDTGADAT
jgi:hypothetical protein